MDFDDVWQRIEIHAGEEFRTITGLSFTYEVHDAYVRPSRAEQNIARSDFKKAYGLFPVSGPGKIANVVRGSAYVYSLLTDPRITAVSPT